MNLDRNTIIGFVLLMTLLFAYIFITNQQQAQYVKEKHRKDSLEKAKIPIIKKDSLQTDSLQTKMITAEDSVVAAGMLIASKLPEQITETENSLMKIGFTSKGGYPKYIVLKNYLNTEG